MRIFAATSRVPDVVLITLLGGLPLVGLSQVLPDPRSPDPRVPDPQVSRAGLGNPLGAMEQRSESGKTGEAAGSGSVEESLSRDTKAAYDNVIQSFGNGIRVPYRLLPGGGYFGAGVPGGLGFGVPMTQWQARPEEAELKLGKFYMDFREVYGGILFTDNENLTRNNREWGSIAQIGVGITPVIQVTENFRIAAALNVDYYPFENKWGLGGPDALFSLNLLPVAAAEFVYNLPIGETDIQIFDLFSVHNQNHWNESYDIWGDNRDAIDRAGRWYFYTPDYQRRSYDQGFLENLLYRNRVGASVSREVVTETLLTAGAYHDNYWNDQRSSWNSYTIDTIYASAVSVRENMRFKPYVDYTARYYSEYEGWDQTIFTGIQGPITDQLHMLAEIGNIWYNYGNSTVSESHDLLWNAWLRHEAGPYTTQSLLFSRQQTYPYNYIRTSIGYALHQQIARDLRGSLFVSRDYYESRDYSLGDRRAWRIGGMLNYYSGGSLDINVMAHADLDEGVNTGIDYTLFTVRNTLVYHVGKTVDLNFMYQFEVRDEDNPNTGYVENVFYFLLRKRFER